MATSTPESINYSLTISKLNNKLQRQLTAVKETELHIAAIQQLQDQADKRTK